MIETVFSIEPFDQNLIDRFFNKIGIPLQYLDRNLFLQEHEIHSAVQILLCRDRDDVSAIIDACPNLKFLFIMSAGVEKLPFKKLKEHDIIVANIGGLNAPIMSEYAMAYILSSSTRIFENYENQKSFFWKKYQCVESLCEKKLLIVGAGHVGKLIAQKAKVFNMHVTGIKNHVSKVEYFDEICELEQLDKCLEKADFIVVCVPLTEKTRNLFNKDRFASMKTDAVFINISRGGLVCEKDLIEALLNEKIRTAILDVFEEEPLKNDSVLWNVPNLIVTPHCSGRLPNFKEEVINYFIKNIEAFLRNHKIPNRVNLDEGY